MWPPDERPEMSKALIALGERPDDMTLYVKILLLRKDKEVILMDAGFDPHAKTTWDWLADGHAIFRITSVGETLLHISDLAHNHVLMFENREWFINFDHNPEVAVTTRKKVFAEIAATRERIYGFHLHWLGIGVVILNGRKGYRWVPSSHRWDF